MIFTVLWVAWIAAFVALEGLALARQQTGDTLSEKVWAWFRVRDARPTALTWVGRGVLLVGGVWLTMHLAFGWWTL